MFPPIIGIQEGREALHLTPHVAQSAHAVGPQSPGGVLTGDALVDHLQRVPGNNTCAECSAGDPSWASVNMGILLCIECSGVHRNMGVHMSKVRIHREIWHCCQG